MLKSAATLLVQDINRGDAYTNSLAAQFQTVFTTPPTVGKLLEAERYDSSLPAVDNTFVQMMFSICIKQPAAIYYAARGANLRVPGRPCWTVLPTTEDRPVRRRRRGGPDRHPAPPNSGCRTRPLSIREISMVDAASSRAPPLPTVTKMSVLATTRELRPPVRGRIRKAFARTSPLRGSTTYCLALYAAAARPATHRGA